MRIRRYEPYEEPQPRRPWTREELLAAVRCVRAMATDEAAGLDPRRSARIAELVAELGRQPQAIRTRLNNVAHVLRDAGLPAPACLPALPGVGRRIAAMILDCWHELDAAGDMAASGPVSTRRPWTAEELAETLDACRRIGAMETRLGRPMDEDEAGDVICETAARLGRRWSETRRVMAAIGAMDGFIDGTAPSCLDAVDPAVLDGAEREALERLRGREGKEG